MGEKEKYTFLGNVLLRFLVIILTTCILKSDATSLTSDLKSVNSPQGIYKIKRSVHKGDLVYDVDSSDVVFSPVNIAKNNGKRYRNNGVMTPVSVCEMQECECLQERPSPWKTVNCTFNDTQDFDLTEGALPSEVSDLTISGCRQFRLMPQALSSLRNLYRMRIEDASIVILKKYGFQDNHTHIESRRLEIDNCGTVVINKYGLKVHSGTVVTEMTAIADLEIAENAFTFLQNGTFADIRRLKLQERAFEFESKQYSRHGPATAIFFQNILFAEIPSNAFRSSADEIKFMNCDIPSLKSDSFNAMEYHSLVFLASAIQRIESGALSDRTQIQNLTISKCTIKKIDTGAVLSAITKISIERNRISRISTGAFNTTIAGIIALSYNEINEFHPNAMVFNMWSIIKINQNTIDNMMGQFNIQYDQSNGLSNEQQLTFTSNNIRHVHDDALSFIMYKENVKSEFSENYFEQSCKCNLDEWLIGKLGRNDSTLLQMKLNSYCTVSAIIARCFNVPEGNMNMYKFNDYICGDRENISCEPVTKQPVIIDDVVLNPRFPKKNSTETYDAKGHDVAIILSIVFVIIVTMICIVIWVVIRYKGYIHTYCFGSFHNMEMTTETRSNSVQFNLNEDSAVILQDGASIITETEQSNTFLTQELIDQLRTQSTSLDPKEKEFAERKIMELYELINSKQSNNNGSNTAIVCNTVLDNENLYEEIHDVRTHLVPKMTVPDVVENRQNVDLLNNTLTNLHTKVNALPCPTHDNGVRTVLLASDYARPKDMEYSNKDYCEPGALLDNATITTVKSNKSNGSNVSRRSMIDRPLPEKPTGI